MSKSENVTKRVWCTPETKSRLARFRGDETYDEVLNRLLDTVDGRGDGRDLSRSR